MKIVQYCKKKIGLQSVLQSVLPKNSFTGRGGGYRYTLAPPVRFHKLFLYFIEFIGVLACVD